MLRARDFDQPPSDLQTQKRRLRRQRMIETALPCALVAALLVAAAFTVGHVGAKARAMERARHARAATVLARADAPLLSPSERLDQMLAAVRATPEGPAVASATVLALQHGEAPEEAAQGEGAHAEGAALRSARANGRQAAALTPQS